MSGQLAQAADDGYSIILCGCDIPYIGTRRSGDIDRCEVCWRVTPAQWESLRTHVATQVAARLAGQYDEARREALVEAAAGIEFARHTQIGGLDVATWLRDRAARIGES